jgi:hypothetical protein
MAVELPEYLPLEEAARRYHLWMENHCAGTSLFLVCNQFTFSPGSSCRLTWVHHSRSG